MRKFFTLSILSLVFLTSSFAYGAPRSYNSHRPPTHHSPQHGRPQHRYRGPRHGHRPTRAYHYNNRGHRVYVREYHYISTPRRNPPPPRRNHKPRPLKRHYRR